MAQEHTYPHLMVTIPRLTAGEIDKLTAIAGVRWRHWKRELLVPHHALLIIDQMLSSMDIEFTTAEWSIPPIEKKPWIEYEPILAQSELHDWVLDGFLTPYQTDAVENTGHLRGSHFWHPTGAGKTLSAILWSLVTSGTVIAVTRAASRLQFGREFERFTSLRAYVIRPLTKKKQLRLNDYMEWCEEQGQRPVIIVGWEALANNITILEHLATIGRASIIFDESHRGKSAKRWEALPLPLYQQNDEETQKEFEKGQELEAKRRGGFIGDNDQFGTKVMMIPAVNTTTAASRLSKAARRVVCTTATPIKDRVRDLWAQLDLAEPLSWGSASTWFFRYCDAKEGQYGGLDTRGESNLEELRSRLLNSVHSIDYRDTHRHLPKKRRQSFYISPEDQCRATAGFPKELKDAAKRGATAVLECRLAQAASKKRRAVLDLIADHLESNHKIVVFTGRRRDVDQLGEALEKHKRVKKTGATIWASHGGTSATDRQVIVDDYMKHKGACVMVGTGDAFGESLNLQDTDAALFVMLPYTVGQIRQWEGRFCRLGQERPVVIYYVVAEGSVDEHIANILISKMGAVEKVVGDVELAEAKKAIGGIDDEDAILSSILEKLEEE